MSERWVCLFEPKLKRQLIKWKHTNLSLKKKILGVAVNKEGNAHSDQEDETTLKSGSCKHCSLLPTL